MANRSILAAFERMWQHITASLGNKSDVGHIHDDRYYTETEIDSKISEVNNTISGTTATYETKTDASAKLEEAKNYTDSKAVTVDSSLSTTSTNPVENQAVTNWLADNVKNYHLELSGHNVILSDSEVSLTASSDEEEASSSGPSSIAGYPISPLWNNIQDIPEASTSKAGIVKLSDSPDNTEVDIAATPSSVRTALTEAKEYADTIGDIKANQESLDASNERISALEETITGLSGAMHFKGVKDSVPDVGQAIVDGYESGDVIIVGNKEYVYNGTEFIEFGDATANAEAISNLDTELNTFKLQHNTDIQTVNLSINGIAAIPAAQIITWEADD